jgi:hypothetical protein
MELRERINGQPLSLEEEAEKTVERLFLKYYRRGYRDGQRAKERELHPEIHYCRECIYWNGETKSIGRRCTNEARRRSPWHRGTADYKPASQKACKTGFELRTEEDPKQIRLEEIITKEEKER